MPKSPMLEAPPRQRDFLEKVMTDKLAQVKFTDQVTAEAAGPQMILMPIPTGGQEWQMGWLLTVWLAHNRLIGQGPVGVTVPVNGLSPNVQLVEVITERLLDEARKVRQKANEPPATPDAAEMMEAIRRNSGQGGNGMGPPT